MTKGNNVSVSSTLPKTTSQKKKSVLLGARKRPSAESRKPLFQSFNTLTYAKSTLFTGTASKTQILQNYKVEEKFEKYLCGIWKESCRASED